MTPGTTTPKPRIARSAIVAAVVLSLGVMGLFLRLQEYGPESAIRKFHQALSKNSRADLQKVTVENLNAPDLGGKHGALLGLTKTLLTQGGDRYRILRADRTPTQVRAVVAYPVGSSYGSPIYLVWVVDRQGRTWRVSLDATNVILDRLRGI